MQIGKLGTGKVTIDNSMITPYIVPSNVSFSTVNINIVNTANVNVKIHLSISELNTPNANDYIEYNLELEPSEVLERTGCIVSSNERIGIFSNLAGPVVRVMGIEEGV